jgi:hypothetical protein
MTFYLIVSAAARPALFDLAIDSKLRECDVVKVRIRDLAAALGSAPPAWHNP